MFAQAISRQRSSGPCAAIATGSTKRLTIRSISRAFIGVSRRRVAIGACPAQYEGCPERSRPQKPKSAMSGSPIGQRQAWAVSVWMVAVGATSKAMRGILTTCSRGARGACGLRVPPGVARTRLGGRPPIGRAGASRPAMPRRWTLPMTALLETPPSCRATWLAERPSRHILVSASMRSSFHSNAQPPIEAPTPSGHGALESSGVHRPAVCLHRTDGDIYGRCNMLTQCLIRLVNQT